MKNLLLFLFLCTFLVPAQAFVVDAPSRITTQKNAQKNTKKQQVKGLRGLLVKWISKRVKKKLEKAKKKKKKEKEKEKSTDNVLSALSVVLASISFLGLLLGLFPILLVSSTIRYLTLAAIPGFIFGIISLKKEDNKTMSVLGITLSAIVIFLMGLLLWIIIANG